MTTLEEDNIIWLDAPELHEMLHPAQPVYNPESREGLRERLYWYSVWRTDTSEETHQNRADFMDRLLQGGGMD